MSWRVARSWSWADSAALRSEARVDRLALESEDPKTHLVDAVEGLAGDEAFERLHAECELPERERALVTEASGVEPGQVRIGGVLARR